MEDKLLFHRQIHPTFVVNDIVSSQAFIISSKAFTPSEKDNDQLSVYNGEKFSARDSYDHYSKEYNSYGVLSLSNPEVTSTEQISVVDDNFPFDGHSYIDFSKVTSKNQKTKKAGKLRDFAVSRGWTYKP
ncbi:hypothetical protein EFA69_17865 [Rufibacter immobilis]|uniref:Uncharacterized protein n=1 Tax=Rufibacter immobilis TaxID=1348778 RepID=A0A3M9MRX1_9BACT|nr:hypothetical protein [Rufibacter immobilis]RNI27955.1 hypothetical protein EFA69_17865 [Rufibacter immobilis]